MIKNLILFIIKIYSITISPDHGVIKKVFPTLRVCIYTPTCSEYTHSAIEKYGIVKGISLGIKRVLRCSPVFEGGIDPVP